MLFGAFWALSLPCRPVISAPMPSPQAEPQPVVWITPRAELGFNLDAAGLPAAAQRALAAALEQGRGHGLLHLGARRMPAGLPVELVFWRKLGQLFMTHLCVHADLEIQRDDIVVPPPTFERLLAARPPMRGAEYVDAALLGSLWAEIGAAYGELLRDFSGSVQEFLHQLDPAWNSLGRVCFHLAENKTDAARPFAFLATYTEGLGQGHRLKHIPLARALQASAAPGGDKAALQRMLEPVRRAAAVSPTVRTLLDSKALFAPQAWEATQAYAFLQSIPACEASGLTVRVPDWWRRRVRPRVTVTVGKQAPGGLGAEALLDFDVALQLDGERLTLDEWQTLAQSSGLVAMRGQWVEVDGARLQQALSQFEALAREHVEGLDFATGMRLLAGMPGTAAEVDVDFDADADEKAAAGPWFAVQAGAWLEEALAEMRSAAHWRAPASLAATLRPYQQVGAQWLVNLGRFGMGACLADDMGLGKTLQVLALLLQVRRPGQVSLLVVPASLLGNWQQEAQRFAPDLALRVAHGSAEVPADSAAGADVVLTTYGMVQRQAWLREAAWDVLVVDEAQAIKNPAARQTRAVKALRARQRIALTGTPVENRAMDLWSLFDFINPGLLGRAKDFAAHVKDFERDGGPGYAPLRRLVQPYILRRLKTDRQVIADLPEKTELTAWCSLRKPQVALYQEAVQALKRQLEEVPPQQRRGVVLAAMTRLKQICNHPSQWLGDAAFDPADSGKFVRLTELCETIAARQEKVLVFTQYREMTEPLRAHLATLFSHPGMVLHGGTAVKARAQLVRRFQEEAAVPFLVLSLKAGGTGLNLTAANHVIHFDRWWNPAVEQQATDRAFRIGQTRGVLVHKFVCRGSVEEKIDTMLKAKQDLSNTLLAAAGTHEIALTELSDAELLATLRLDLNQAMKDV